MNEQLKHYRDKLNFEIDSADLANFFTHRSNGDQIVVIDTRSTEAFEKEHIPGAINFPHRNMNEKTVESLSRNVLYVTYCDGIGCNGSTKGALRMTELGFKVKELIGGLDWWKREGYSTEGSAAVKGSFDVHCAC